MEKQLMLQKLEEKAEEYRKYRPSTAEMDIAIFRAFCSGKSAVRIAMDTPCAESTVYRAIRRVKDYLKLPEMVPFMEVLRKHVAAHMPHFGDWNAESVLQMLYVAYCEYNRFETDDVKSGFEGLYELLRSLPLKNLDAVIDAVCDLCHSHEQSGFTEGLKVGVRLGDELRSKQQNKSGLLSHEGSPLASNSRELRKSVGGKSVYDIQENAKRGGKP